ncbi:hypothetical protein QJS66_03365 [Kocuria rhizophila]|nr:hypothetical protein QJS66_03365 [Kocuria rhizophila]
MVQDNPLCAATGLLGLTGQRHHASPSGKDPIRTWRSCAATRNKPRRRFGGDHGGPDPSALRHQQAAVAAAVGAAAADARDRESMGTGLDPEFDLVSSVQPYAERFIMHRLSPRDAAQPAARHGGGCRGHGRYPRATCAG